MRPLYYMYENMPMQYIEFFETVKMKVLGRTFLIFLVVSCQNMSMVRTS